MDQTTTSYRWALYLHYSLCPLGAGHPLIFIGIMSLYMIIMLAACNCLAKKEDEMTSDIPFHVATYQGTSTDSFSLFLQNIRRLAKMTDEERGIALEKGTIARDVAEWALRSQKYYNQSKGESAYYVHSLMERKILPLARIYFDRNEEYSTLDRFQALEDLKFHLMDNSRDYDKFFQESTRLVKTLSVSLYGNFQCRQKL